MTTALIRPGGSSFELTVTIPWTDVKKIYDLVFAEVASEIEIEGFRKGKAPQEMVAKKVDKAKVYGEVVNRILPGAYQKALAEHNLKPIIAPKVQIAAGEEERDWQFIIRAAEKPRVDLDNYKQVIAEINAKGKIWKPGEEEKKQEKTSEVIAKLVEVCGVELSEIMLESEVNRLTTSLVDDVRQAGLTFEQYLASSSQTAEQVREKFQKQAEAALKLEFILEAVADDLNVQVSQEEIDKIVDKETDSVKKKALSDQKYILASILRREDTITKLLTI